jgi:hypothetical protein
MKGRQPGRPTKWVRAQMGQDVDVDRAGFSFVVWEKWKRIEKRVGTLTVSVGGLRWLPAHGKARRRRTWREVADWLSQ